MSDIGTLNERSLHRSLKELLAERGDEFEVPVGNFVVDIKRGSEIIEIQTSSFGAMARKLDVLLDAHTVRIVHPIAIETYLHRDKRKPRRSPKKGTVYSLLDELVSLPTMLDHPNLTVDAVLVSVDKIQRFDDRARRGRGGWVTVDRRLREIHEWQRFKTTGDLLALLPLGLPSHFTTADIAPEVGSRTAAQRLVYCLRQLGSIEVVDRTRSGVVYQLAT